MNKTNQRIEDLLARRIARVSIRKKNHDGEVTAFLVDRFSRQQSELKGINIKVKLVAADKDYLNKYINIASKYPTCDYMRISSDGDAVVIHLIEQTDLAASFANKMENDLRSKLEALKEDMSDNKRKELDAMSGGVSEDLIVHEIAHEMLKKFISTLAIMFVVQERAEFKGSFPNKQTYHFAILDVQSALDKRKTKRYGGARFRRVAKSRLRKNILNLFAQIGATIERVKGSSSGDTAIGPMITTYSELHKSTSVQK